MAINKRYDRRGGRYPQKDLHKINDAIRATEVRLVVEGIEPKVYSISEALKIAEEKEMDLVEISGKSVPPVCKVIDYKKFIYDQKKKQKEIKAKSQKIILKEIRFGPNTDIHDYEFKLNHAKKFIEEGAKVKAFVFFKGRTIIFKERGEILLLKLATALENIASVESMPKMEGKRMIMFLAPKKKVK